MAMPCEANSCDGLGSCHPRDPLILRQQEELPLLLLHKKVGRAFAVGRRAVTGATLNIYGSPIRHMRNSSLDRKAPMRNLLLSGTMPSAPAKSIPSVKFAWLVSPRNGIYRPKRSSFGCASLIIH